MLSRGAFTSLLTDALLRRGWQHDGREPMNPARPGPRPQKVPLSL